MTVNSVKFLQNRTSVTPATARMLSPALWGNCPVNELRNPNNGRGTFFFDDFTHMPLIGTQTTQIGWDKYKVFATSGEAVTPVHAVNSVDLGNGYLDFSLANNNESASLADAYPQHKMSGSLSTANILWFEASVAVKSLLTLRQGFFVGLAETDLFTLATGVPYNADGAVITNGGSMIGFNRWEIVSTTAAATTSLTGGVNTVYSDRATSFTVIEADCGEPLTAAFTFVKLGFLYDPTNSAKTVRFFINNVERSTGLSNATLTGTTNLKANSLGLMLATVAAASVSTDHVFLDWWAVAQLELGVGI